MKPVSNDTTIAFLKAKGWKEAERTRRYHVLRPPGHIKTQSGFDLRIPIRTDGHDYQEYMTQIAFSIADLYEMNKWELMQLLSSSIAELQRDVELQKKDLELKKQLLSHAS